MELQKLPMDVINQGADEILPLGFGYKEGEDIKSDGCATSRQQRDLTNYILQKYSKTHTAIIQLKNEKKVEPYVLLDWCYGCRGCVLGRCAWRDTIRWYGIPVGVEPPVDGVPPARCYIATKTYNSKSKYLKTFYVFKNSMPDFMVEIYYKVSPSLSRLPKICFLPFVEGLRNFGG